MIGERSTAFNIGIGSNWGPDNKTSAFCAKPNPRHGLTRAKHRQRLLATLLVPLAIAQ